MYIKGDQFHCLLSSKLIPDFIFKKKALGLRVKATLAFKIYLDEFFISNEGSFLLLVMISRFFLQ